MVVMAWSNPYCSAFIFVPLNILCMTFLDYLWKAQCSAFLLDYCIITSVGYLHGKFCILYECENLNVLWKESEIISSDFVGSAEYNDTLMLQKMHLGLFTQAII